MKNNPQNLTRWTRPDCYMGAVWPDYYGAGFGQSRDSDCLEESNFAVVRARLDKLPRWEGEIESRFVVRESHWAVGWVEWIAIHESDTAALELCDGLKEAAESYPVLDEEDFSNREMEAANVIWRDCYSQKDRSEYVRKFRGQFDFRGLRDAVSVLRGDYFSGYASELLY